MMPKVYTARQVYDFFPHTVEGIEKVVASAMEEVQGLLDRLYAVPGDQRTLENTVYVYDELASTLNRYGALLYAVEAVYPEEQMRQAAHHNALKLQNFGIEYLWQNKRVYEILESYKRGQEYGGLDDTERYFVDEQIRFYERQGVHLGQEVRTRLKDIQKELAEHTLAFDRHIAADVRFIRVTRDQLVGLSEDFIAGLRREGDLYILAVDYPTYFQVMENCSEGSTRKALWHEFANRAYPANEEELAQIIALRDEYATRVGYKSFAELDISSQMAKSPEAVERFLDDLVGRSEGKVEREMAVLRGALPQGVTLTEEGTFRPWDLAYVKSEYKKHFLQVDETKIAEYFPLEQTIEKLLSIYERFLGLKFKKSHLNKIWHEHVDYIMVYRGEEFIGSLLMDLFPRPGKYTHACHITLVPTVSRKGEFYPALSLVLANFPWPRAGLPALLPRQDVITFFHEFGHAVHALLGSTEFALCAGTNVKDDFVEMPSQMLEEWMWDRDILREASGHYETGKPLPDELIERIMALRQFDSGYWVQRQVYFSLLSLYCFKEGAYKDIDKLHQELFERIFKRYLMFTADNHDYASFGHLTGYAAKYYGYLWSKVFALDLFGYIKHYGLLNDEIGKKYTEEILSKGGSRDPEELLYEFLGRKPTIELFLRAHGL